MRLLMIGDVNRSADGDRHVGDEAMYVQAVRQIRSRTDASVTLLTDVQGFHAESSEKYLQMVSVPSDLQSYQLRLADVLAAAQGGSGSIERDDSAWPIIDAVASSTGVLICGGGNLNSTFPHLVFQRHLLAKLAKLFNKPLVVTGQTFGPQLENGIDQLVAEIVVNADLVGCREQGSFDIALRLGTDPARVTLTTDDAMYMSAASHAEEFPDQGHVAWTVPQYSGSVPPDYWRRSLTEAITTASQVTGLEVLLVPHTATKSTLRSDDDVSFALELERACPSDVAVRALASTNLDDVLAATASAQMVVSGRYHPLVFALGESIPAIGISTDAYTAQKIGGVMANFGVGAFQLSGLTLPMPSFAGCISYAWEHRAEIQAHLRSRNEVVSVSYDEWWDAVVDSLSGNQARPADLPSSVNLPVDASWEREAAAFRALSEELSSIRFHNERRLSQTDAMEAGLRLEIGQRDEQLVELHVRELEREQEIHDAQLSVLQAQRVVGEMADPIYAAIQRPDMAELLRQQKRRLKKATKKIARLN